VNYSSLEEAAAEFLIAARRARRAGDRLPESCRPADVDAALAIQRRVSEVLGEPIGGWKAAMPSPGKIMLAPIYAATIFCASPCTYRTNGVSARVEPEVAFVLCRDLGPRAIAYSDDEVVGAIAETRLVLELLGGRYADPAAVSFPEKLADGLNNQGLFVGSVVAGGLERVLDAFPLTIEGPEGLLLSRDGRHPAGHPLAPLCWLANFLAARGEGLKAGQVVTTGSYCGALELPLATPLRVTFDGLGCLAVEFVADQEPA
jgi:2-keto-4-pentenoate hydratase